MDVDRFTFPSKLLAILEAVSESTFVALDLELSGVPVRPYGVVREKGQATLQERYAETKAAAERYQILQIGITCVKEDTIDGTYELKTFNANLSPCLTERLDIDRDFSFHSGAVEFLNSVGFDFNAPLVSGVPYLSREEADLALQRADERLSRTSNFYDPLNIKPEETESLALLKRVKKLVKAWVDTGNFESDGIWLGPKELGSKDVSSDELSRFEKRLVHQIVRQEFPDLVTIPRRGGIHVTRLDVEREASIKKSKLRDTKARISRQTGFGWVIEAIAGGSLRKIDVNTFTTDPETGDTYKATLDTQARFDRSRSLLERRPRPLVGHNMFLDLIYLYRTFIGELPDTVKEFAAVVHDLFPIIVDTKYLATHECGDINPMSSLQQLAEQMEQRETPLINIHPDHSKYTDYEAHHEAGYDSLLTAKVAIRLSAMLEAQKQDSGASSDDDNANGGVCLQEHSESNGLVTAVTEALKKSIINPVAAAVRPSSQFAHTTAFDSLAEDNGEDEQLPVLNWDGPGQENKTPFRLMPQWSGDLWREYGNRLRVFGTQEGICLLHE